ncbi:MAG: adenosyl-hopene transferase HpnH [Sphingomonas sp.]|jgi:hopanoid biosynthesis associated radical SAM protein HpnH|uniref:adenosyl-hopene transferase HpnH n=1 Tax=unclassified Sphingomonas TaxID=196159 RepID=UPI00053D6A9D|nr:MULTISPECIES: adenosyl-hopene transferase HpnH [unclassified Sphingomonas]MDR6849336.1 hopanoid biosynthesis associated radical SAM protein HpnH [Sphingomonas sp. BE137]MDR7257438.1 hopanoid biosynthesis associated radical SAM protein HpnH [Sphingomonas sp. BE270]RUN75655.1 adenosyl-hopene transferase HpnH [Sphingomonas sp. TF3]
MSLPLAPLARIGAYTLKNHIKGGKYPLVLMLEPLLRCNLACPGCGKIDYPDAILNQRLSYDQCMDAIDECGAPAVSIAGGEPLLHRDMPKIVQGYIAKKKFVILCTNALLMKKKIDDYKPSPYFTWSIHLDGDKGMHDHAVDQAGTYEVAIEAIEMAKAKGFRVQVNCTVFDGADPTRLAAFFDEMQKRGVEITISPGYSYERAADQEHFLTRERTKNFFRDVFRKGDGGKAWTFTNSPLFLDFLAGNQTYECTPWSMPLRTVFGWQKPCYLVGEGYVDTFAELMEGTDWDQYGVGKYEKCSNCMVHCGFEGTAASDSIRHPLKMFAIGRNGVRTEGPMAPDIDLSNARKASDVHSLHVERELAKIKAADPEGFKRTQRAA